jgi:hypothetical protein
MRKFLWILAIVMVGAAVMAPAVAYLGLDPMPGDFAIDQGNWHFTVPVTYSLCASLGLGLFYYFLKR